MASEYAPIDISKGNAPDLAELAEEVHRTNRPRVLRRADEDIAVIAPVKRPVKRSLFKKKSQADIEAFLSAAGSWNDEDTDALKEAISASRHLSTKPRPEL